jgi:hypothetical protein
MTAKPDFLTQVIDVLRERMPKDGDQTTGWVLRLFLRTGWSFENYVGPLVELEQHGWIKCSGETYTTTAEGARALRDPGSRPAPATEPPKEPPKLPARRPPPGKARWRRR